MEHPEWKVLQFSSILKREALFRLAECSFPLKLQNYFFIIASTTRVATSMEWPCSISPFRHIYRFFRLVLNQFHSAFYLLIVFSCFEFFFVLSPLLVSFRFINKRVQRTKRRRRREHTTLVMKGEKIIDNQKLFRLHTGQASPRSGHGWQRQSRDTVFPKGRKKKSTLPMLRFYFKTISQRDYVNRKSRAKIVWQQWV